MKKLQLLILGIFFSVSCSTGVLTSEPKTYDECILKHLKSGMTKDATIAVRKSCRTQFPASPTPNSSRAMTGEELQQVTGTFKPAFGENTFYGNLYNGNRNLRVIKLEILINYSNNGKDVSRNFILDTDIDPITSKANVLLQTSDEINKNTMKSWRFVSGTARDQ